MALAHPSFVCLPPSFHRLSANCSRPFVCLSISLISLPVCQPPSIDRQCLQPALRLSVYLPHFIACLLTAFYRLSAAGLSFVCLPPSFHCLSANSPSIDYLFSLIPYPLSLISYPWSLIPYPWSLIPYLLFITLIPYPLSSFSMHPT